MAGHVAQMGEKNASRIMVGKQAGKRPLEDQDTGGWTMLKLILDRMGWYGLHRSYSG
jgi:hypothetical protein